jgi:hypothetical protein
MSLTVKARRGRKCQYKFLDRYVRSLGKKYIKIDLSCHQNLMIDDNPLMGGKK